jgi:hypothetical protein
VEFFRDSMRGEGVRAAEKSARDDGHNFITKRGFKPRKPGKKPEIFP